MSLYRGIVSDASDPTDRGRVRVDVPDVTDGTQWAELVTPIDAVDARIPEVGTPVWVAFEGNDHSTPIVVGRIGRSTSG